MGLRSRWALRASAFSALWAEVFAQAVVSRGEGQDGFAELLDPDLSGEAILVQHGQEHEHLVALGHGCGFELFEEGLVALLGRGLFGGEARGGMDEAEPGPGLRAEGAGVVAVAEGFDRLGADGVQEGEVLVVAVPGVEAVLGDAGEGAEDVDGLELVGDVAAGGEGRKGGRGGSLGFRRKVRWLPMVSMTVSCLSPAVLRRPRPNCWSQRMRDSVGRSMRTVSSSGRSRPSLKTSTAQMTSRWPAERRSSDWARLADVGPEWTATALMPCSLKKPAMKSAWG